MGSSDVSTTTTKKSENRRSNKPIMEKRRRARINSCLNELKSLILDAMKKDPARHSKLEKADILEMTVKHLQSLKRDPTHSQHLSHQILNKFNAGFAECAGEVAKFPGLEPIVRRRLLRHLSDCLTPDNSSTDNFRETKNVRVEIIASPIQSSRNPSPAISKDGIFLTNGDEYTSVKLVPTRLPNGDIALVLPSRDKRTTASISPPRSVSIGSPLQFERLSVTNNNADRSGSRSEFGVNDNDVTYDSDYLDSSSPPLSPNTYAEECSYDPSQEMSKPLSLVVRKRYEEDSDGSEPWRPW